MNNSIKLMKRLIKGYLAPHKKRLTVAIICMLVVAGITAKVIQLVEPLVNGLFDPSAVKNIYIVPLTIVVLFFVKGVASYFVSFYMEYIGQRVISDFQQDLYKHIINQDLTFFQNNTTSELSSRFLFDVYLLKSAVSRAIVSLIKDSGTIVALIIVMFIQDWRMALIAFTVFPIAAYPIVKFGRKIRRYSTGTQEQVGSLSTVLKESFMHNRQVKIYTMEDYESQRANDVINSVFKFAVKVGRVRALSSPVMEMLGGISIAVIMIYGTLKVQSGTTDAGTFMSFLAAVMSIYRPLKGVSSVNNIIQEGLSAAERTFAILDTPVSVKDKAKNKTLTVSKGEVEFKKVTFSYPDGTKAIHGLDLILPAGKKVALVGASGAGKSTVLNLIPRFFNSQGKITIDGQDITKVSLESLRRNIGLVTQDIAIFDDTIHNNIAYGCNDDISSVTREEVTQAAKKAAAHDFISNLEHGYDTRVGEEGFKLSGGQKQRIAIARAMLKNAPIMLLDEATSNLDNESEAKVQEALNGLMKGRTSLIVAHRLSTIVDADIIHVMENGKIVESGSHKELLAQNGLYSSMYRNF